LLAGGFRSTTHSGTPSGTLFIDFVIIIGIIFIDSVIFVDSVSGGQQDGKG
jgi:hypothetical protein